jgi:hypothetical protein
MITGEYKHIKLKTFIYCHGLDPVVELARATYKQREFDGEKKRRKGPL